MGRFKLEQSIPLLAPGDEPVRDILLSLTFLPISLDEKDRKVAGGPAQHLPKWKILPLCPQIPKADIDHRAARPMTPSLSVAKVARRISARRPPS